MERAYNYVFKVYPRVCGGTSEFWRINVLDIGLSPRVRGNQPEQPEILLLPRSIPACAGEPPCLPLSLG